MATFSHNYHSYPVHSRWSSHRQGRSVKRWARSANLHEIKVLGERRGSGGAKRAL
ncbi:hypothetical protein V8E55_001216, partial [Tylopilus felleus]